MPPASRTPAGEGDTGNGSHRMSADDTADAGARLAPTTHVAPASAGKSRPVTCNTFPPHISQGMTLASDGSPALAGSVSSDVSSPNSTAFSSASKRNVHVGVKLASLQLSVTAKGVAAGTCAGTTHRSTRESSSKPADAATGPTVPNKHPARASAVVDPRQLA